MSSALMAPVLAQFELGLSALPPKLGRTLFIGYSGGVDSEMLAAAAAAYQAQHPEQTIWLVHVHHGLSDHADTWVAHCQARAQHYQLPLTVRRVALNQAAGQSLEALARDARYHAISELMRGDDVLLTAHHEDDQLETVLLALTRGFGPLGLSAMGALQAFDEDKWQCRPFLAVSRQQLESWAQQLAIPHIDDESNQDTRFDRNYLRHEIIPRLKQRWPAIARTASRSASLCAEEYALLEQEVDSRLAKVIHTSPLNGDSLSIEAMAAFSESWQMQILRRFIQMNHCPMPSRVQLQQALMQMQMAKEDAKVSLQVSGCILRRFAGNIFVAVSRQIEGSKPRLWPLTDAVVSVRIGSLQWQVSFVRDGLRCRAPRQDERVELKYWGDDDISGRLRCHPSFRRQGRELKKMWQELGVAPWLRDDIPLIFYNHRLVASGLWVERDALVSDDAQGWQWQLL
ncbi:tRNA lysidine(34) synthetase TilS [Shewanella sp. NIFS-20-20]|uniref:tRNA lysidine(34) synthetase TilS n=1 Tax=Shewanella sp. NIFS-20-20 TaxID=2853806 RepID=UPI001C457346|nr:tRNA lysidine(34) synthetase TilS [Shewanella sp. NIFS-20-20]MBV7316243.1 tRNA lysidine(34) synthetase TilS [Shewanella sp. NIFS-20-20]